MKLAMKLSKTIQCNIPYQTKQFNNVKFKNLSVCLKSVLLNFMKTKGKLINLL